MFLMMRTDAAEYYSLVSLARNVAIKYCRLPIAEAFDSIGFSEHGWMLTGLFACLLACLLARHRPPRRSGLNCDNSSLIVSSLAKLGTQLAVRT